MHWRLSSFAHVYQVFVFCLVTCRIAFSTFQTVSYMCGKHLLLTCHFTFRLFMASGHVGVINFESNISTFPCVTVYVGFCLRNHFLPLRSPRCSYKYLLRILKSSFTQVASNLLEIYFVYKRQKCNLFLFSYGKPVVPTPDHPSPLICKDSCVIHRTLIQASVCFWTHHSVPVIYLLFPLPVLLF